MLLNMDEMLSIARKENFAVGAFNICDSLLFKTVLEAAIENNSPVIIQLAPPEFNYVRNSFFKYVLCELEKARIPAVLHLDHGKTIADCVNAIRCGFTSVMIDGSKLDYNSNVNITKKITEIAHSVNVSVEGELGTIESSNDNLKDMNRNTIYTNPDDVSSFIKETNVDSLAVSIGTLHGIYPKEYKPELRLDILEKINRISDVPLVLHGGSSNSDLEIMKACKKGINKVNIASDYRKVFFDNLRNNLVETGAFWTPDVYEYPIEEAKKEITHKMELFDSINKGYLYWRNYEK